MGAEVDLSSTAVAAYSAVSDVGGSFEFRDGNDKTGITVGGSRSNFGGLSRKNRVRYVFTPWKSVEFYGSYFLHMLDLDQGSDPDDINMFVAGARVKF